MASGAAHAAGPTQAELNNAVNDSANWPYVDHDYHGQRYTPFDQITAKNAADLAQTCSYSFPEKMPGQTAPTVYDGILYAATAHYTVALDGASCKVMWQSEWKPRDHETFDTLRGVAMKDGKVVRGTADGYLLALDIAVTGGDVVLASEITGDFLVFDAQDGKILYKHNVGGPAAGGW